MKIHELVLSSYALIAGPNNAVDTENSKPTATAKRTSDLREEGRYAEAIEVARETLERAMQQYGAVHPLWLGEMENLADLLASQKDDQCVDVWKEYLADSCRLYGLDSEMIAPDLDTCILVNPEELSRLPRADLELLLSKAGKVIDSCRLAFGNEHPNSLTMLLEWAIIRRRQHLLEKGAIAGQVASVRAQVLGHFHRDTLAAMDEHATNLFHRGKLQLAMGLGEHILIVWRRDYPDDLLGWLPTMKLLMYIYNNLEKLPQDPDLPRLALEAAAM